MHDSKGQTFPQPEPDRLRLTRACAATKSVDQPLISKLVRVRTGALASVRTYRAPAKKRAGVPSMLFSNGEFTQALNGFIRKEGAICIAAEGIVQAPGWFHASTVRVNTVDALNSQARFRAMARSSFGRALSLHALG